MTTRPVRRVLVAFDKFKGALDAESACRVAAAVLARQRPSWQLDLAPLSDGGDGFCSILTRAADGVFHAADVSGPRCEPAGGPSTSASSPWASPGQRALPAARVRAPIGLVELARLPADARAQLGLPASARQLAVIDMASASGLALVPRERRDVFWSSSAGTGQLLLAASQLAADAILLGVGGSATSDLGLGALQALGLEFSAGSDAIDPIAPVVPALWPQLAHIAGTIAPLPPLRIACDVDNPVFGPRGAAAVYGPQKGLAADQLAAFEHEAQRIAALLCRERAIDPQLLDAPGSGAAGAIAFGLLASTSARLVPGAPLVSAWLDLDRRIQAADHVLTGEGRYDQSSASGKGPGALLEQAARHGRAGTLFAGSLAFDLPPAPAQRTLIAISDPAEPLEVSLRDTAANLEQAVERWVAGISEE